MTIGSQKIAIIIHQVPCALHSISPLVMSDITIAQYENDGNCHWCNPQTHSYFTRFTCDFVTHLELGSHQLSQPRYRIQNCSLTIKMSLELWPLYRYTQPLPPSASRPVPKCWQTLISSLFFMILFFWGCYTNNYIVCELWFFFHLA